MSIPLVVAALSSVSMSAQASAAAMTPGPPTDVHATAIEGVPGVTVSWGAPVSDGGAPILYYVASNYSGNSRCVSLDPGPGTCHIDGLSVGSVRPSIRVRALNANGPGPVVVTFPVVTPDGPANGGTSTSAASSGTSQTGLSQTPSSSGTASSASGVGTPAGLASTGADVQVLFVLGMSLVLGGSLILSPLGRRRRVVHPITSPAHSAVGVLAADAAEPAWAMSKVASSPVADGRRRTA